MHRAAQFIPRIGVPEKKVRRVVHAKFGEGVVIEEAVPRRLKIDLGAEGVKLLLEWFVKGV